MKDLGTSKQQFHRFREAYREGQPDLRARGSSESKEETGSPESRRRHVRKYVAWLWPHRFTVGAMLLLTLGVAGLDMVQPLFMRYIIDQVLLDTSLESGARYTRLNIVGAVFLSVVIIAKMLDAFKNYRQRMLNVRVILALRRALFQRLLRLPIQELTDMKTGGILSRLSGDTDRATGLLQLAIISPGVSAIRLLIALGILFYLNWQLALIALMVIPPAMLLSLTIARRIRPIYRSMRKDSAEVDARVSETFSGIRVVRAFQRETHELADFLNGRHTLIRKELFAHRRELVLWTTWGFLLAGINVVIIWFGGSLQIASRASVGDIMAFQWYTLMLLNPVWQIVNSFSEMQRSLAATERVFEVLEMPTDKPDPPGATSAPLRVDELRFEHVWFEYHDSQPVVRDFHVTVAGGSTVALVGRSGAGKSTVTDLVARFHDPTHGRMLINGRDVREFRLQSYRDLLAVVEQHVFLFDGTVRENIAYGQPHASDDEIVTAAKKAHADEFILNLPKGYESVIGERGVKLSGGQAQRISIARALLADPQILILDEATSNLDTESEQLIQESLVELIHGRTTFVIAHRLSTVARADVILVMDDGRIIEHGTHQELMALGGDYRRMVERQRDAMLEEPLPESEVQVPRPW